MSKKLSQGMSNKVVKLDFYLMSGIMTLKIAADSKEYNGCLQCINVFSILVKGGISLQAIEVS